MVAGTPRCALITGGAGFIGSNFLSLAAQAWPETKFVNLDKLSVGARPANVATSLREDSSRYRFVWGNYSDKNLVLSLLREWSVDAVVHFAATTHVDEAFADPAACLHNNVTAYIPFLEACSEYGALERFLHVSTDEVYGDSELGAEAVGKTESSSLDPTNPYAASKAAAEHLVSSFRHSCGLPALMIRMNNVYGPRQFESKLIPKFTLAAIAGQPFTIQGDGKQLRNWLFVSDACEAIRRLVEAGRIGEVYNIGSPNEHSVLEVAEAIQLAVAAIQGTPAGSVSCVPIPDRPYNDTRYLIDSSKIQKELGWAPRVNFRTGLRLTVEWTVRRRLLFDD